MTFREKMAWVSLIVTGGVWGFYFLQIFGAVRNGPVDGGRLAGLFGACVGVIVVLHVALAIAAALAAPKEADAPADERERMVELKSTNIAYAVLCVGVVGMVLSAPLVAGLSIQAFRGDTAGDAILVMANSGLLALVAAELVRSGCQIAYFRLGG